MKDVIMEEMIFLHQNLASQEDVFRFLAEQLIEAGRGSSKEELVRGFYAREKEFSTALNDKIAIPHCRNLAVKDATVLIIRNERDIAWTDQEPVDLMFALMVPAENENQIHLRILAQVAQLIMEDGFIQKVRQETSPRGVYQEMKALNDLIIS